jgi:hypothetical protein
MGYYFRFEPVGHGVSDPVLFRFIRFVTIKCDSLEVTAGSAHEGVLVSPNSKSTLVPQDRHIFI